MACERLICASILLLFYCWLLFRVFHYWFHFDSRNFHRHLLTAAAAAGGAATVVTAIASASTSSCAREIFVCKMKHWRWPNVFRIFFITRFFFQLHLPTCSFFFAVFVLFCVLARVVSFCFFFYFVLFIPRVMLV